MSISLTTQSRQLLVYLLSGNRKEASGICKSYHLKANSIRSLYDDLIKPALYEVGRLWEQNQITVATEHMATAITEGILNEFYPEIIPEEYNGKKVVLTCVTNEEHQVGIKMVADIFELHGWESYFLGVGAPTSELIKFIKEHNPTYVAISLSVYFNHKTLNEMINELQTCFPAIQILIGGQAFSHHKIVNHYKGKGILHFESLTSLEKHLQTIN